MSHAPKPLPAQANETSAQQTYRQSCRLSFLLSSLLPSAQPFSRPSFALASAPSSPPRQEASPASSGQRPYLEKTGRLRRKSTKTTTQQAKPQPAISMKTPIQFADIALATESAIQTQLGDSAISVIEKFSKPICIQHSDPS